MPNAEPYALALLQMACAPAREENLQRAEHHIRDAAAHGARLVCLPELFLSPYFCQSQDMELFDRFIGAG